MEIIKIEKIKLSNKEYEAFELIKKCLNGIVEASSNPKLRETASSTLVDFYILEEYVEEVVDEEPTEEHCWDERHIPSQFELNP